MSKRRYFDVDDLIFGVGILFLVALICYFGFNVYKGTLATRALRRLSIEETKDLYREAQKSCGVGNVMTPCGNVYCAEYQGFICKDYAKAIEAGQSGEL